MTPVQTPDLADTVLFPAVTIIPAPAVNRRGGRRLTPRSNTSVACRPNVMDVGPNVTVAVIDLSDSGVQLRVKGALPVGQVAVLTLGGSYNGKSVRRTARVRWCAPVAADGTARVGFAFDSPVGYAELTHFVRL